MPTATIVAMVSLLYTVMAIGVSGKISAGEGMAEAATCKDFCRQIPSPDSACKNFIRALPRPKMGRACKQKFREAFSIHCTMLCTAGGEEGYLRPWIDRFIHNSCRDMSSHIPYPAVFNSCKAGYREGFAAASTAVSKRFRNWGRGDADEGNNHLQPRNIPNSGMTAPPYQHADQTMLNAVTVSASTTGVNAQPPEKEIIPTLQKDVEDWIEALDKPPVYIDYATVAKDRVSASRKKRPADLKRGPACPVCSG